MTTGINMVVELGIELGKKLGNRGEEKWGAWSLGASWG